MSTLLQIFSSRNHPQGSPIPTGTPPVTPSDRRSALASPESRNPIAHKSLDAEGLPENTVLYIREYNESTTRPRSVSPNALQSPEPTHCPEIGQRSESSAHQPFETRAKFSRHMKALNPRLLLENSGSVARDHLASERTFLAYVRTSLAIASAGVALVQLFTIADLTSRNLNVPLSNATLEVQKFARPLGMLAVVFAFIVLVIGLYRYFLIQRALPEQRFPTARVSVAFTSFVLGGIIVAIFIALLKGRVQ